MNTKHRDQPRLGRAPRSSTIATVALLAAIVTPGCGTRLSDDRIAAAAGVSARSDSALIGSVSGQPGGVGRDGLPVPEGTVENAGPAPSGTGTTPRPGSDPSGAASPGAGLTTTTVQPRAGVPGGQAPARGGPAVGSGSVAPTASSPSQGTTTPASASKPPIVLGHVGDYSGIVGTLTKGGDLMTRAAVRYLNESGGLGGHPIELITADAGGDPARALSIVRDMVEQRGAVALLSSLMAFSGNGVRDYVEQRKIPLIGGDGTTPVWQQSPAYFSSSASFESISFGALQTAVDLGKKKIAVVYCVEAGQICKTWRDTLVAEAPGLGASVVYEAQVSVAQPDYTAECLGARRNGAEAMMIGLDGPSIARLARSCAQQGYKPQLITASLAVVDSIASDPNLDGLVAPQGVFPYMVQDSPATSEFQAVRRRLTPTLANSAAIATVWTGAMLLREVAKTPLPSGTVKSTDFFPGLWAIKANTLGGLVGPITFSEREHPAVTCVFMLQVTEKKWTAPNGSQQRCR